MSSSSENEDFHSNVQLPSFNAPKNKKPFASFNAPKNKKPKAKSYMPTKFLPSGKSVRFPEQIQRNSMISNKQSSDSEDSDSGEEGARNLPSFSMQLPQNTQDNDSLADDSSDDAQAQQAPDFSDTDSSSEDEDQASRQSLPKQRPDIDQEPKLSRKASDKSISPRNSNFIRRESTNRSHGSKRTTGTDITDLESGSMFSGSNNSTGGGIKGILRKMSLMDSREEQLPPVPEVQSTSDTFLGRVLSFAGENALGGGGLAPGASKSERKLKNIDEEQEVGMEDEDENAIELKKLDFAKLSQEAHDLLKGHVPENTLKKLGTDLPEAAESAASDTTVADDQGVSKQENEQDQDQDQGHGHSSPLSNHEGSFLTANPELFLRGEANSEMPEDDLLLDDNTEAGYVEPPKKVHAGVLSSLLRLYQNPNDGKSVSSFGGTTITPTDTRGTKGDSSDDDDDYNGSGQLNNALPSFQNAKPMAPKKKKITKKLKKPNLRKFDQQLRITVHIADILQRQRFILRMCKALMLYGAPTHRLEEYMVMTSRVLEIDGQFIYFPGCMIVSFGDAATRTSEVHLVRCAQGLNLSKLSDTHAIYKQVIHDLCGVEQAAVRLEELLQRKNLFNPWWCVLFYGLGSAAVTPFAFGGGWLDIPVAFGVGLCVGYLQFFVSSKSNLYSSVFEVTASIVVSFISRGIGSIKSGKIFCFSAIAQGSLALILPGYIILCGSLELQSRNIVAGSVRMFYAVIYSLFLGFGITLGAALYGWVDKNSISESKCSTGHGVNDKWRILFVPMFSMCLGLINQARWRQLPVMIIIASSGYVVTYFAGLHFSQVTEFTAALGAFIVGILGNMYSRIWKGMAVAAMLPAIFVQVPSGIASQSTLLTGIESANKITNSSSSSTSSSTTNSSSLSFGTTMVEVAIGISVGLFAAALVVYPFGKKRTGLFTL